jgi:hypothetical protein
VIIMTIDIARAPLRGRPSRIGLGLLCVGVVSLALGVLSRATSAWEGSCYDEMPAAGAWSEFRIELADLDIDFLTGSGQPSNNGALTVVLSGATAADVSAPLTVANVGSIDFTAEPGVAAVYVRAGETADNIYRYDAPATEGTALRSADGTTPIEWLTFCYATPTATTSTTTTIASTSTTTAPTTTVPTTRTTTTSTSTTNTTVQQLVVEVTTTVPTAVLGEQVERVVQPQLALTGANSSRLLVFGVVLVLAGCAMMVVRSRRPQRS